MTDWDNWFLAAEESTRAAREYLSAAVADDTELVEKLWASSDDLPQRLALLWEPYLAYLRTQGIDEAEYWRGFCAWMSQTEALIGVGGHPFNDEREI